MKFPNLAWALKAKKLPQYRAARAVGISAAAFSRGLAGERHFTAEQRYAIAKLLDLSAVWLFSEIKAPRRRRALTSQARLEA
jgi:transcriptional regulator with XRE-family HTH domain